MDKARSTLEACHSLFRQHSAGSFFKVLTLWDLACLTNECRYLVWVCCRRIEAVGYEKAWLLRNQLFVIEGRNTEFGL